MAKSRRNKEVKLTAVKRNSREKKLNLVESIRSAIESHKDGESVFVYLLALNNQRNSPLKNLRIILKPGRVFYGKNKVMQLALGQSPESELANKIHKIAERISGEKALLVSSDPPDTVKEKLESYKVLDFSKSGNLAKETVILKQNDGVLHEFPGNMEPQLRQLGLPTALNMGKIQLLSDFTVCEEGRPLTPNQAQILKLLGIRMALFEVRMTAYWHDGTFVDTES